MILHAASAAPATQPGTNNSTKITSLSLNLICGYPDMFIFKVFFKSHLWILPSPPVFTVQSIRKITEMLFMKGVKRDYF